MLSASSTKLDKRTEGDRTIERGETVRSLTCGIPQVGQAYAQFILTKLGQELVSQAGFSKMH